MANTDRLTPRQQAEEGFALIAGIALLRAHRVMRPAQLRRLQRAVLDIYKIAGVDVAGWGEREMTDEHADLIRADRILLHLRLNARIAAICHTRSFASLGDLYDSASEEWESQHSKAIPPTIVGPLWRSCVAVWTTSHGYTRRAA